MGYNTIRRKGGDTMLYCEKCKAVCPDAVCPVCGKNKKLREVRDDDPCLLDEKDMIWSEVLEEVLEKEGIPVMKRGRLGAGLAFTIGPIFEKMRIYVPYSELERAKELARGIFEAAEDDAGEAEEGDPEDADLDDPDDSDRDDDDD